MIRKLPVGTYRLHYKEVAHEKGYVKGDDLEFTIEDTREIKNIQLEQEYTKIEVSLLDKETLEGVIEER